MPLSPMNCTSGYAHLDVASATSEPRNGTIIVDDAMRVQGGAKSSAPQLATVFSGFLISLCTPNRGR